MTIKILGIIVPLLLLAACSKGGKMEKPIAKVALIGSYHSVDYLFEIFSDKRLKVTASDYIPYKKLKTIPADSMKEQKTTILSNDQYDDLLEAINNFIAEDFESVSQKLEFPAPCFDILAVYGKRENELGGGFFVGKDEARYYQVGTAEKLKSILEDVSPIQIKFVRAQD